MFLTLSEFESRRLFVREYIDQFCIYRVLPGEPLLPGKLPDTWSEWQFYMRRGLFNPEVLTAISEMFLYKAYQDLQSFDFQIAGLETASTPLLAGIPLVAAKYGININALSIRKNKKEYGLLNWIEGRVNDKPIMLIDDLCASTASLRTAYEVLLSLNLTKILDRAFCVINKRNVEDKNKPVTDLYLSDKIQVLYLYSLDDFGLTYKT